MNKLIWASIVFSIISTHSSAMAKAPKIKGMKNGFYQSSVGLHTIYRVDTISQLCFASLVGGQSLTAIDCSNLAKRPEWKPIINWVD